MFTSNTRIIDLPKEPPRATGEASQVIRELKGIAQTLGISEKTLTRWRKDKVIGHPTIMQVGNIITANKADLITFKAKRKNL